MALSNAAVNPTTYSPSTSPSLRPGPVVKEKDSPSLRHRDDDQRGRSAPVREHPADNPPDLGPPRRSIPGDGDSPLERPWNPKTRRRASSGEGGGRCCPRLRCRALLPLGGWIIAALFSAEWLSTRAQQGVAEEEQSRRVAQMEEDAQRQDVALKTLRTEMQKRHDEKEGLLGDLSRCKSDAQANTAELRGAKAALTKQREEHDADVMYSGSERQRLAKEADELRSRLRSALRWAERNGTDRRAAEAAEARCRRVCQRQLREGELLDSAQERVQNHENEMLDLKAKHRQQVEGLQQKVEVGETEAQELRKELQEAAETRRQLEDASSCNIALTRLKKQQGEAKACKAELTQLKKQSKIWAKSQADKGGDEHSAEDRVHFRPDSEDRTEEEVKGDGVAKEEAAEEQSMSQPAPTPQTQTPMPTPPPAGKKHFSSVNEYNEYVAGKGRKESNAKTKKTEATNEDKESHVKEKSEKEDVQRNKARQEAARKAMREKEGTEARRLKELKETKQLQLERARKEKDEQARRKKEQEKSDARKKKEQDEQARRRKKEQQEEARRKKEEVDTKRKKEQEAKRRREEEERKRKEADTKRKEDADEQEEREEAARRRAEEEEEEENEKKRDAEKKQVERKRAGEALRVLAMRKKKQELERKRQEQQLLDEQEAVIDIPQKARSDDGDESHKDRILTEIKERIALKEKKLQDLKHMELSELVKLGKQKAADMDKQKKQANFGMDALEHEGDSEKEKEKEDGSSNAESAMDIIKKGRESLEKGNMDKEESGEDPKEKELEEEARRIKQKEDDEEEDRLNKIKLDIRRKKKKEALKEEENKLAELRSQREEEERKLARLRQRRKKEEADESTAEESQQASGQQHPGKDKDAAAGESFQEVSDANIAKVEGEHGTAQSRRTGLRGSKGGMEKELPAGAQEEAEAQ